MTSNGKGWRVSEVVGRRLRAFRESKGLRQEDVAAAAQSIGLKWARSSVAALEGGARALSVEEFLLVPALLEELGGWDEPILMGSDGLIVSDELTMSAMALPEVGIGYLTPLRGTDDLRAERRKVMARDLEELGNLPRQETASPNLERHQANQKSARSAVYKRVLLALDPDADTESWDRSLKRDYEITRNIAVRLQAQGPARPHLVRAFAFALYGRTVGAERDARVDERGPYDNARALRSAKGHATREIIKELAEEMVLRRGVTKSVFDEYEAVIDDADKLKKWLDETARMG